jgi:predicted transcriptional regulator of viral defense system
MNFCSPHYTAITARLVAIEDKLKAFWDCLANLYFSPGLRKVADDALDKNASSSSSESWEP